MSGPAVDLFDFLPETIAKRDAAAEREARWNAPATCPACGTTEPRGWLLRNNHGLDPDDPRIGGFPAGEHPIYGAMCTAQYLVKNHITYYARRDEPTALAERMERGRGLGLDVDAIVAEARR